MIDAPVIFFDGVCNLCNKSVQFVLKRDFKKKFKFASLQSKSGQALLKKYDLPATDYNSFILLEQGKVYMRSTAALRVLKILGGKWKILYSLIAIPTFLRNGIYNWIARNRYKWFGKKEECWIPTPDLKNRFLD